MAFTGKNRKLFVGGRIPSGTDKLLRKTQVDLVGLDSQIKEYAEKFTKDINSPIIPKGSHEIAYYVREYNINHRLQTVKTICSEEYLRIIPNSKYSCMLTYLESEIVLNGYTIYAREFQNIELGGLVLIEVDENLDVEYLPKWVGDLVTNDLQQYTFESLFEKIETMRTALAKEQSKLRREAEDKVRQEELERIREREERIAREEIFRIDDEDDLDCSTDNGIFTLEGTSLISNNTTLLGAYHSKRDLYKDVSEHTEYSYLTVKEWRGSYMVSEKIIDLD